MHNRDENLENIRLASDEPDLTPEEEYIFYQNRGLRTKKQLLEEIQNSKLRFLNRDNNFKQKSESFYVQLEGLIDKFYNEVSTMFLMEELSDWWGYGFAIRETGIKLKLEHLVVMYEDNILRDNPDGERHYLVADEDFTIHHTKSKLLSLEEYGLIYGVAGDTVRQWIRRGKIRSAVKLGSEWRIPELSDKPIRGYSAGHYRWSADITDPLEEIFDMNNFDNIHIMALEGADEWCIGLSCYEEERESSNRFVTGKIKEKIELYLLAHPLIECVNNALGEIHQKNYYKQ